MGQSQTEEQVVRILKSPEALEMAGCEETMYVFWQCWGFLNNFVCQQGILGSEKASGG